MNPGLFAEVVVLSPVKSPAPGAAAPTFTYHLPGELPGQVAVGSLVVVPFGAQRIYGIVVGLSDESPVPETRPVESLVDPDPLLTPPQIELARWMSREYLAPLHECLTLMLPPGVAGYADVLLELRQDSAPPARLTPMQRQLVALLGRRGPLRGAQLDRALPRADWRAAADQLVPRGVLARRSFLAPPRARPKQVRTVRLATTGAEIEAALPKLGRSSQQADVLDWLAACDDPAPTVEAVWAATGCSPATLRILADKGWVEISPRQIVVALRVPSCEVDRLITEELRNAPAQATALAALRGGPQPTSQLADVSSSALRTLEEKELITRTDEPALVLLLLPPDEARAHAARLRGGDVYRAILEFLRAEGEPVDVSWVYAETGCAYRHLKRLAELELIVFGEEEAWRDPLAGRVFVPTEPPPLTPDQQTVWDIIKSQIPNPKSQIFLLHGVTGSGKTEIYLRAVAEVLAQGKQAIVLVPEISLTPQTVRRFAARFPGRVAVLHSRLSEGERYDTWRRARAGLVDIVIGPRSALFSPLRSPGLIALDEEHDDSYKQESRPYYHAREAALELARLTGATVILGSATPSLESYHRAQQGEFRLLEMPRRIMGHQRRLAELQARYHVSRTRYRVLREGPGEARYLPLPPVQVVDLRAELRAGNRSIFSRALQRAMDEVLRRGEQAILFLNRRGTATFVLCRDCGLVVRCPNCDTPLTYHGPRAHLVCHHCNHRQPQPEACPRCGSGRLRYFGLGTEGVERAVQERWPQARLLRWDRDTARTHAAHEAILQRFVDGAADVLIGTQMIAKGLDLPLVTVVGVISADTALNLPDFRAGERTFQLLAQVAGRAGRGLLGGRVVLQTYNPDHYAVAAAAAHDYARFAQRELAFRRELGYPPYRRLAKLVYAHTSAPKAQAEAEGMAQILRDALVRRGLPPDDLLGPAPPFFARIRGQYRWQLLLRHPDPAQFLRAVQILPGWRVDVDPVSVL